ncbi:MAG: helicase-related protein [Flavobacteriaceae bacterium]
MSVTDISAYRPARARGVTAVLGPTNTGKTHLAIERMLGHSSGVIGLPLRLLAREVYDRVAERAGPGAVALVTGEERIKPDNPRYWVATVEAMPRDLDTAFVAVDEVQLAADLDRGHVFTDRLLSMRGREETLLLGADTMQPLLERLMPGINVVRRPRFSELTFAGERKLTRLPRRSAIIAFSAEEVYAIAELIRRQRGGAAVVLGALSPRTRNAQVEIYQSGDVDFIVATDAIGMGLNLDIDHVAFAATRKFDGFQRRDLNPAELAQIAGRAGRHMRNGSFGTSGRAPALDPEVARQIETHDFAPLDILQWRNSRLDFSSAGALRASLDLPPPEPGLVRAPLREDVLALDHLLRDAAVAALASAPERVERLWEVCQIPDYRKIAPANHGDLLAAVYTHLMRDGHIPDSWFAEQVAFCDRTDGDIDAIANRISHIRTWTYIANRDAWLRDPAHWQGATRALEDRLSDALHERLTQRFVDRRTGALTRRLRETGSLDAAIGADGKVDVEGHHVGKLSGFRFTLEPGDPGSDKKALRRAAMRALDSELNERATALAAAPDNEFSLTETGEVAWRGETVARLARGASPLQPEIALLVDDTLAEAHRARLQERLAAFVSGRIATVLKPLFDITQDETLTGAARGIGFQLVEELGVLERTRVHDVLKELDQPARATLRRHGVRFGAYHVFVPALMKPAPRRLAAELWALGRPETEIEAMRRIAALALTGRTSIDAVEGASADIYRLLGFRLAGPRAVRIDIHERLAALIRNAMNYRQDAATVPPGAVDGRSFTTTLDMMSLVGAAGDEFANLMSGLGYRAEKRPADSLPKPAPAAEAATEAAAAADETAQDAAAPAGEVTETSASDGGEEPVDTPAAPQAETPGPEALEAEAPEAEATEAEAVREDVPAAEAAPTESAEKPAPSNPLVDENGMITVWRQQRQHDGPRRPGRNERRGGDGKRDGGKREGGKREGGNRDEGRMRHAGKPGKPRPGKPAAPRPERPRDKPLDPDSPFAALAALRDKLGK